MAYATKKAVTISIEPEMIADMHSRAKRDRVPFARVIELAIERYLKGEGDNGANQ